MSIIEILEKKVILYPLIIVSTTLGCIILMRVQRMIINRSLRKASQVLNMDPTRFVFLKNTINAIIICIGVVVVFQLIPELRQFGLPIFASAGVLAFVVGFASQQALSNIVGGFFIVIFKPFRVGDIVNIGNQHRGTIEDITLRHTVIKNFENRRIVIPNSIMNSEVIENSNLYDERTCIHLEMDISYTSSIDLAMDIMRSEAELHPLTNDARSEEDIEQGKPRTMVRVISLNDSSITLRAMVWVAKPADAFPTKCDLLKNIKLKFDEKGVEIPFPQRVVHVRGGGIVDSGEW